MDFFGGDGQLEYTHPHGIGHGVGGSGAVVSQFANTLSFVRRQAAAGAHQHRLQFGDVGSCGQLIVPEAGVGDLAALHDQSSMRAWPMPITTPPSIWP